MLRSLHRSTRTSSLSLLLLLVAVCPGCSTSREPVPRLGEGDGPVFSFGLHSPARQAPQLTLASLPISTPEEVQRTKQALRTTTVSFDFSDGTTLDEVLDLMAQSSGIPFTLDPTLRRTNAPLKMRLHEVRLSEALDLLLSHCGLSFVFSEGGIYLTSPGSAHGELVFDLYNVTDLLNKVRNFPGPPIRAGTGHVPPSAQTEPLPLEPTLAESSRELWVIVTEETDQGHGSRYGGGRLVYKNADGVKIPLPLESTSVTGDITGSLSTMRVTQHFENTSDRTIEARYVFPLPHQAAVHDFRMTIGDRQILGVVRRRAEAEEIYAEARAAGQTASLLTQERPNVFTQKLANLGPQERIEVEISYYGPLRYVDGSYELAIPLTVGARSGSTFPSAPVAANACGHDVSIELNLDARGPLGTVTSPTHQVNIQRTGARRALVSLAASDRVPNRDFVLRYEVAGEDIRSSLVTHIDDRGGFFRLLLVPPANTSQLERDPRELIFVIDCSGSMAGRPLELCKEATRNALLQLRDDDCFKILRFSDHTSALSPFSLRATKSNLQAAFEYLESLDSSGGTDMLSGIRDALTTPEDSGRTRVVSFMTDGYIGNEAEIFAAVDQSIGNARLFSFGVGVSVNRFLLDGIARFGWGAAAYILDDDSVLAKVDGFYESIGKPALCDVEIDWHGMDPYDLSHVQLPDLLVGRPTSICGRFDGSVPEQLTLIGTRQGQRVEFPLDIESSEQDTNVAVPALWARSYLRSLSDEYAVSGDEGLLEEITELALEYQLVSVTTAFLAVDEFVLDSAEPPVTIDIPSLVPGSLRPETAEN